MLRVDRWWLVTGPMDLRCGADRLLGWVAASLHRDWQVGAGYVFRNRSGNRLKVLVVDAHGVWLCTRRLHQGSFCWPRGDDATWQLTQDQFDWLCKGVDWQRLSHDYDKRGVWM